MGVNFSFTDFKFFLFIRISAILLLFFFFQGLSGRNSWLPEIFTKKLIFRRWPLFFFCQMTMTKYFSSQIYILTGASFGEIHPYLKIKHLYQGGCLTQTKLLHHLCASQSRLVMRHFRQSQWKPILNFSL